MDLTNITLMKHIMMIFITTKRNTVIEISKKKNLIVKDELIFDSDFDRGDGKRSTKTNRSSDSEDDYHDMVLDRDNFVNYLTFSEDDICIPFYEDGQEEDDDTEFNYNSFIPSIDLGYISFEVK